MARRQTLVQLTDELLEQLDARAARQQRSRSELVREALINYLATTREAEIDRLIVEGYTRQPQTEDELAFADLAARSMRAVVDAWDRGDAR